MKKVAFIFSLVLFTVVFTQAQVVQSSQATQTSLQSSTNSGAETFYLSGCALPTSAKPSLSSEDLVIEKNVKISKVSGAGHRFWI
jgi:guanyl-specific ribonuclease Sa